MANGGTLPLLVTVLLILISTAVCSHEASPPSVIRNSSRDYFWHALNQLEVSGPVADLHPDDDEINTNGPEESDASAGSEPADDHKSHHGRAGIHVASWRWDEIGIYFTFTSFIIIAGLAKVGNATFLLFSHFHTHSLIISCPSLTTYFCIESSDTWFFSSSNTAKQTLYKSLFIHASPFQY